MRVGIPRALSYYFYEDLWLGFFKNLNIETVVSPPTNKAIIKDGIAKAIDEACYSSKIFKGHVNYLLDKCDLIFVPRIESTGVREEFCTRMFGVYELVKHTFPNARLLHADINVMAQKKEPDAFIKIGSALGKSAEESLDSYSRALADFNQKKKTAIARQDELLAGLSPKVLIASHAYNTYDAAIGKPVIDYFNKHGIKVAFADLIDLRAAKAMTKEVFGNRFYWRVNLEIMGGVLKYGDFVDGIVLISTFPCGPDGITNELILRTVRNKPILNIMIDELSADAGLATRLESFTDVISANKRPE